MSGPCVFEKNKIDIDALNVTITATDTTATDNGQGSVDFLRNRKNDSGWATTGSNDAALSTLEIATVDAYSISEILLVAHNFKAYTIKYWDDVGLAWTDFSTPIAPTNNALTTTRHSFTAVTASRFQLIVQGTQTANADKVLAQLILTNLKGQFVAQPHVKKPKLSRNRKSKVMLSGRVSVTGGPSAFSATLAFPPNKTAADLNLIVSIYDAAEGLLFWLCGGDTTQFAVQMPGFRLQDLYLMKASNELDLEWKDGVFAHGQAIEIALVESRS